jgi:hypothetical protein
VTACPVVAAVGEGVQETLRIGGGTGGSLQLIIPSRRQQLLVQLVSPYTFFASLGAAVRICTGVIDTVGGYGEICGLIAACTLLIFGIDQ